MHNEIDSMVHGAIIDRVHFSIKHVVIMQFSIGVDSFQSKQMVLSPKLSDEAGLPVARLGLIEGLPCEVFFYTFIIIDIDIVIPGSELICIVWPEGKYSEEQYRQ